MSIDTGLVKEIMAQPRQWNSRNLKVNKMKIKRKLYRNKTEKIIYTLYANFIG